MHSNRMALAEAQAAHGGDRRALLAAIDEATAEMQNKHAGRNEVQSKSQALMQKSQVNAHVARDLVSHASGKGVADLNDFSKPSLKKVAAGPNEAGEEELRSLRSEYDYGSKKKFVDVLGNVSIGARL